MTRGLFEREAYSNGGLFQNVGLHGGLFEYGDLIGTGGLNEDFYGIYLDFWDCNKKVFSYLKKIM